MKELLWSQKTITHHCLSLFPIVSRLGYRTSWLFGFRWGRFPFSKNSGLKFRKFPVPDGTVHFGCTDPTQATAHLVIVLASRIQKSGTGNNDFVKWKGTFRSDRPKWPDRSKWTTFKADPEYSGRTKPKWSVPFDVATEITGILGWMESALGELPERIWAHLTFAKTSGYTGIKWPIDQQLIRVSSVCLR